MYAYLHLVRAPGDPVRTAPRGRGEASANAWRDVKKSPPAAWADRIVELLKDGRARTFNCIAVELVGFEADQVSFTALDDGLWLAVKERRLALTKSVPVFFRAVDERGQVL